jgi:hypothetical protein
MPLVHHRGNTNGEYLSTMILTRLTRTIVWLVLAAALVLVIGLAVGIARRAESFSFLPKPEPPRVSHDLVVQQLQDVAKLVSTEMTLRDVVVYDASRYGFTKRALLVVTGKVGAGIDLAASNVQIDDAAHRITITLPRARVMSVEVLDVRTYDESAGLFNPFRPEDRDSIQRQVRHQLFTAGEQSGLLVHADSAASKLLKDLLSRDGYTVDIVRSAALTPSPG